MDIHDLYNELKSNKIKEFAYLINPSVCVEGAFCLKKEDNGTWSVILVDRGEWCINESFKSENEACRFLLKRLLMDPTTRIDFKQEDLLDFPSRIKEILNKYNL